MSAMIPLLTKRHAQCRAKSHGANFYLVPGQGQHPAWVCYSTTAAQIIKLIGPKSDLHQSTNWEENELEKPFYLVATPEKHVRAFVALLSTHGSVAMVEPSAQLGADRNSMFECICVVPHQKSATTTQQDVDDLL